MGKTQILKLLALAVVIQSIGGCREFAKTKTESRRQGADASLNMSFASEKDLPICSTDRIGQIAFLVDEKTFRVCENDGWKPIDLRGEKGDQGAVGTSGADAPDPTKGALKLHETYRRSIFRVELTCSYETDEENDCKVKTGSAASTETADKKFLGSAFLCEKTKACTNKHVVICPKCYKTKVLTLQSVFADTDSIRSGNKVIKPFFKDQEPAVHFHATKDLAKIDLGKIPEGAVPLKVSSKSSRGNLKPLQSLLSMSFTLGLQDLYTDLGAVNTRAINECNSASGSKYGCPAENYDFATSNDTDHGSSGSPLIDIDTGTVLGVTAAGTMGENANFTWAIDASQLHLIGK